MTTRSPIFSMAAEFVSSLAWEIGSAAAVWEAGGSSWPDTLSLRKARGNILSFPRIPNESRVLGYDLVRIPKIEADETYVGGKDRNRHWNKKSAQVRARIGELPAWTREIRLWKGRSHPRDCAQG
jgi:hypothetical protein